MLIENVNCLLKQNKYLFGSLKDKADKATTLSDYGITDAYTKTEIDNKGYLQSESDPTYYSNPLGYYNSTTIPQTDLSNYWNKSENLTSTKFIMNANNSYGVYANSTDVVFGYIGGL